MMEDPSVIPKVPAAALALFSGILKNI